MSKAFVFGFAIGLTLFAVIGVGASRRQRDVQRDAEEKARQELAQYNAEIVDATPVQMAVRTERERIHGKLYRYQYLTNKTISELLASPPSRILGIDLLIGQGQVLTESRSPESYFGELVRASDVVIRGKVTKKASQITEDGAFIFTDYDVSVMEILKDNSASPLAPGSTITVTRPGGKVVVEGIIVKARDRYFGPLPLSDHPVLLFLRYIPETAAYKAINSFGAFEVDGSSIRPLTEEPLPPGILRNGVSPLQTVRAISSR